MMRGIEQIVYIQGGEGSGNYLRKPNVHRTRRMLDLMTSRTMASRNSFRKSLCHTLDLRGRGGRCPPGVGKGLLPGCDRGGGT